MINYKLVDRRTRGLHIYKMHRSLKVRSVCEYFFFLHAYVWMCGKAHARATFVFSVINTYSFALTLLKDRRERPAVLNTQWRSCCWRAEQRLAIGSATQTVDTLPLPLSSFSGAAREGRGVDLVCASRRRCLSLLLATCP